MKRFLGVEIDGFELLLPMTCLQEWRAYTRIHVGLYTDMRADVCVDSTAILLEPVATLHPHHPVTRGPQIAASPSDFVSIKLVCPSNVSILSAQFCDALRSA